MITDKIVDLRELCDQDIEINGVYTYNQTDILKRIYAYTKSRYLECSDPDAIFYNISNDRSHHFAKNIDLDTKDNAAAGQRNRYRNGDR